MSYEHATNGVLRDLETKPEAIDRSGEEMGSRSEAMAQVVATTASNYIKPDEPSTFGQTAQGLSDWNKELTDECSRIYKKLTSDENGPLLSKKEANADEFLQTLQAIRRGVRLARQDNYKGAKGQSAPPKRGLGLLPMFMIED